MKILRLRALNINSLSGKTDIDFSTLLQENSLFAITGSTGSGKSTLLDIISCALYAKTPRLTNVSDLISRDSGEAFCEVEFEIKGEVYCSSWKQKKAYGKYDGKIQPAKMELVVLSTGKVLASSLKRVPEEIERLSGLDFDRFSQSMMLAQGSFDAFLKAKESNRSELLEKITGTKIYTDISQKVYEQYNEKKQDIQIEEKSLENIDFFDQELVEEKEKKLQNNKLEKNQKDTEAKKIQKALHWLKTLEILQKESQEYKEKFFVVSKEKEENKDKFIKLELATRALQVAPLYTKHNQLNSSVQKSSKTVLDLENSFKNLEIKIEVLALEYSTILENYIQSKIEFESVENKIKESRKIEIKEREAEKYISKIKKDIEAKNRAKEALEKKLLKNKSTKEYKEEDEVRVQKRLEEMERLLIESDVLIRKYKEDRKNLKEGEPCYLCGSLTHPFHKKESLEEIDKTFVAMEEKSVNKEEMKELRVELQHILQLKENKEKAKREKQDFELQEKIYSTDISLLTEDLESKKRELTALTLERIKILNVANLDIYEKEKRDIFAKIENQKQELKEKLETLRITNVEKKKQINRLLLSIDVEKRELQEVEKELQTMLEKQKFENMDAFMRALVSSDDLELLQRDCKELEEKYTRFKTLKEDTNKKLEAYQKEPVSIQAKEELSIELQALEEIIDKLQLAIGSEERELEINSKNMQRYRDKIVIVNKKRKSFKVWEKMQELIGSANGAKFAKFAQGITLDQLIYLANQHLKILSQRYILIRSRQEKHLLELEIIDSYQGNLIRPVTTLSGGESFIVSLALALGLSELASQKISIDSLFMDEGFGTLDKESLEVALNALNLLQHSGKMVGVISHVEALKESIPLQIKVLPNGDGTSKVMIKI